MPSVGQPNQNSSLASQHEQVAADVAAAFAEHAETPQAAPQAAPEQVVTQPAEVTPPPENTVEQTLTDGQGIQQAREVVEQVGEAVTGAVATPVANAVQEIKDYATIDPSQSHREIEVATKIPQIGRMADAINEIRFKNQVPVGAQHGDFENDKDNEPVTSTESTS